MKKILLKLPILAMAALKAVAAASIFLMMSAMFIDVVGRYVFNSPLLGGFEMVEFLMALSIFTAVPFLATGKTHIRVDILDNFGSLGGRRVRDSLLNIASGIISALMAYVLWIKAASLARYGAYTDVLEAPVAPLVYAMCLLMGVSALCFLANAVDSLARVSRAEGEKSERDR